MITPEEIRAIVPSDIKRIEIAKIQKLWEWLPKDFAKQLATKFKCSAGMAKYVKDITENDPKRLRGRTRKMLLFLGEIAAENKAEIDEIDNL